MPPVEFDEETVLAEASQRTGLDDFGAEDFRERLARLARKRSRRTRSSARSAASASSTTASVTRPTACVSKSCAVAIPRSWRSRSSARSSSPGLPRSGTTHLLNLIAADPRLRSLPYWESLEPIPDPGEAPGPDGRRSAAGALPRRATSRQLMILPLLKNMHDMSPEHVHEEIEVQASTSRRYLLEWIATVPRWRDYYLAHDQTPHYAYMKRVLQALQWMRGPDRWVLKSPQHMEQLVPLIRTFPDATVALTASRPGVRDRVGRHDARLRRSRAAHARRSARCRGLLDRPRRASAARLRARPRPLPERSRASTFSFHEFMADDVGMVERIYALAFR